MLADTFSCSLPFLAVIRIAMMQHLSCGTIITSNRDCMRPSVSHSIPELYAYENYRVAARQGRVRKGWGASRVAKGSCGQVHTCCLLWASRSHHLSAAPHSAQTACAQGMADSIRPLCLWHEARALDLNVTLSAAACLNRPHLIRSHSTPACPSRDSGCGNVARCVNWET